MKFNKKQRLEVYNKFDGRCAYCGHKIEYKDMQIDHIKPILHNWNEADKANLLPAGFVGDNSFENLYPSCRACNFRKDGGDIETFRHALKNSLNVCRRNFTYRMAVKYGLITEHEDKEIKFYFENLKL